MLLSALFPPPLTAPFATPRAPAIVASGSVVALDFDGVLCDSEPELTRSAWRTAKTLWPELMASAADLSEEPWRAGARRAWTGGDWQPLQGDGADGLPNWLAFKMRTLRPSIETGYESMLLIRLCVDEALAASRATGGERPLTSGEICANWPDLRDALLARYALREEEAVEAFGSVRDSWIADDLEGWLDANRFYPGAVEAMRGAINGGVGPSNLYVVTTKQQRFALELLRAAGLELDDDHVFGLGSGPKVQTLCSLQQKHEGSTLSFVEDRVDTLRTVANDPRLFGCRLFFAGWGYSDSEQQAAAASMPRVRSLGQPGELEDICAGVPLESKDWRDA